MSDEKKAEVSQTDEQKVSPAELKKRAKAEKQARRAAAKEQSGPPLGATPQTANNGAAAGDVRGQQQSGGPGLSQQRSKSERQAQPRGPQRSGEQRQGSSQQSTMPVRNRRGSQSVAAPAPATKKQENKQVELFSHLYSQQRRHTIEGASKDVHPAVLALGLQFSSYEICGSSARCVAMLEAFKEAIQAYTIPTGTALARHFIPHYLSPQIEFLISCRPNAESMGNAIRWLKKMVGDVDPDTPEQQAKDYLCDNIDRFIQERIIVTDQAIAASASSQIKDGSVVLTYAKSAIVEKTILQAHANGTKFRVVVVDSRPLFEGKNLAISLMNAGLQIEYLPFSGIARAVSDATIVLLGAHSMLSNGRLRSRVGTASIAMAAHRADIPVIVCCESVKFSGKVALDSIVLNEVAPPDELLPPGSPTEPLADTTATTTKPSKNDRKGKDDEDDEPKVKTLRDWRDIPNLQILNLMYDVTPAEHIRMVICEYGNVPPSSVPVVHRLANEGL